MNMTNHTQQPELGSQHVIFAAKFARTGEFSADPTLSLIGEQAALWEALSALQQHALPKPLPVIEW
jgi:hypothetical protein